VTLAEAQRWFAGAVMGDVALEETGRRLTAGPRLGARERLDVYRSGYVARLVECLADDYPILQHALGAEAFEARCRSYVARHPSEAPNLNAYGRHMPAMSDGFTADLARLEWAIVEVIHEPSSPPLTMQALTDIPMEAWATSRLVASRTLRIVPATYPVNEYFQAAKDGQSPAIPSPAPSVTVVYRSGRTVWRMGLTPPMHRVLAALLEGRPLEAALDTAGDEPVEHVSAWFREWVSSGLFVRVDLAR
jgi:hypothetical protein